MTRVTWADVMTVEDRNEQRKHDKRHPGRVCPNCPMERAYRTAAAINRVSAEQHRQWVLAGFLIAALMLALALIVFFA